MIGVISKESEISTVQEFFELFKTPWEFYVPHHVYDIVIATRGDVPADVSAKTLAIYNSNRTIVDDEAGILTHAQPKCRWLEWDGDDCPIYGNALLFQTTVRPFIRRRGTPEALGFNVDLSTRQIFRIGYDLFEEVNYLLSQGQPPENAHIPTLDIHISVLKSILANAGISFVEIPPVPADYDFMTCLTHDVDFTGIREHKCDHTMWGFIYRALVSSLLDALRRRMEWSKCVENWKAVFSLPLVHLGWQKDFWQEFDRYLEIEKGLHSTYFFIPFKDYPGTLGTGAAPKRRATKYDVNEIKEELRKLVDHGCEVGLHGIDAWHDSQKAQIEANRIRELTGQLKVGVRMHWLYFGKESPETLDQSGFPYDSTFGYNDSLGFRGGTTQVFCPKGARNLLELPLNIQDTAMFYPGRMNLSETEALEHCKQLIQCASVFGGALTVNWHTRSLSPERLWGDFYLKLLQHIKSYRVWFGTALEIVTWFRKRRDLRFEEVRSSENSYRLRITGSCPDDLPFFRVRILRPTPRLDMDSFSATSARMCSESIWRGETEVTITREITCPELRVQ